jgi:hypothetical protein
LGYADEKDFDKDGRNRTLIGRFGSCGSTIELRPQIELVILHSKRERRDLNPVCESHNLACYHYTTPPISKTKSPLPKVSTAGLCIQKRLTRTARTPIIAVNAHFPRRDFGAAMMPQIQAGRREEQAQLGQQVFDSEKGESHGFLLPFTTSANEEIVMRVHHQVKCSY